MIGPGLSVWKFNFDLALEEFTLDIPEVINHHGEPTLVALDPDGKPAMWFHVKTDGEKLLRRTFKLTWTGDVLPEDEMHMHLATFISGKLVWHLFEYYGRAEWVDKPVGEKATALLGRF